MPIKTLYKSDNCLWLDCENPSTEDLQFFHEKYSINSLMMEDMRVSNHLPKYEEHSGVKFFLTRENTKLERSALNTMSDISTKLGIYLVSNTIITVHRTINTSINECEKEISSENTNISTEHIALKLAQKVLLSFDKENKRLLEIIDTTENDMFLNNQKNGNTLRKLYKIKRQAGLNYRLLAISGEWVNNFKRLNINEAQWVDLQDRYKDVLNGFDHLNTQITQMISLYLALSDQKANQVMKILAMYSVYFLPITFIAGLYGMNFEHMPELKSEFGYLGTLVVMVLIVLITFIYFKQKKWK